MAATAHPALPAVQTQPGGAARRGGFALRGAELWHLLSLDAPTVAMLWTWFVARANHIPLPATAVLAMGTAVWVLYAADRLMDCRAPAPPGTGELTHCELEPRHHFHRLHQSSFRRGILAASAALAFLLPQLSPQSVRLYLVLGVPLAGYFAAVHVIPEAGRARARRLPKELAVGAFFSAATFIPTVAGAPGLRAALAPGAVLFAAVCSLNCLFIYRWEHPAVPPCTHPATKLALRLLPRLTPAAALSGPVLAAMDRSIPWQIPAACGLAAVLLLVLDRNRRRLSPTTLRAAADLCLLTPLLLPCFGPR